MRAWAASLALLGLCACARTEDAAGPERADGPGLAPACSLGALPVTGLCSDADPSLFLAVDAEHETAARGCIWRTHELQTKEAEALVFRAQDCAGEMWDRQVYAWVGRYVKARPEPIPEDQAIFILEVLDVPAGQTAEDVAMATLRSAPEDQRGRCALRPRPGTILAGRAFDLAPRADLAAELEAASEGEPLQACGFNGVAADVVQFWEARERHALFHMIGPDEPLWDPASFTFYVKGADGVWSKSR